MLSGVILKVEPIRYTPAGLPVLQMELDHRSEQMEVGIPVKIEFAMKVKVVGEIAQEIARLPVGTEIAVKGFLARASRRSDATVLHVNSYKLMKEVNHGTTV